MAKATILNVIIFLNINVFAHVAKVPEFLHTKISNIPRYKSDSIFVNKFRKF